MSEFENITHVETEYDASEIQVLEGCLLYTSPSPRDG